DQFTEKRRRQAVEIAAGLADDMARNELGRVFEHVDETMQLTQNIVGDMLRSARFTIQVNRDLGVAKAQFTDERPQVLDGIRHVFGRIHIELFVVYRQNKSAGAALLLCERGQVAVTG